MNRTNYQTIYYTQETELASFAPLPQFLLRLDFSMTARVLYAQLLNRAKLSRQNGWIDDQGKVTTIKIRHSGHGKEQPSNLENT